MSRVDINLGDLARALRQLAPEDDATAAAIARVLGYELPVSVEPGIEQRPQRTSARPQKATAPPTRESDDRPPTPMRAQDAPRRPLSPRGREHLDTRPAWIGTEPIARTAAGAPPAPHIPLFDPRFEANIVARTVRTYAHDGAVDVDALVRWIATGRAIDRVPRHARATLRRGVQVLLDRSAAMMPFWEDQTQLLARLRALIGNARVAVRQLRGSPLVGADERSGTWRASAAPSGAPVLALTDLGIGGSDAALDRGSPEEWARFAEQLESDGYAFVALVPYAPNRWPAALSRVRVVTWDRSTRHGPPQRRPRA